MIPAGVSHPPSYGHHFLLHPHYGHRGSIPGLTSAVHGLKLGGTGTSASGAYVGGHYSAGYHPSGYSGNMGVPSGGHPAPAGYDYHSNTGPHAPIADTSGPVHSTTGKAKSSGPSTVTALTLLSFLFFLNILQGCLKEHMDTMNPTVMVMTAGVARTRVSKLAEMNSREQQHTVSQSLPQPVITLNRGEPAADSSINEDQVSFNGGNTKIEYSNGNQNQHLKPNQNQRPDPEPEYYSVYANRTTTLVDNNYQERPHSYRHYQRLPGSFSSPSSSLLSSPSSSSSLSNSGGSNYYSDSMDPYYMRIN